MSTATQGRIATGGILPPEVAAFLDGEHAWTVRALHNGERIATCYGPKAKRRADRIVELWNAQRSATDDLPLNAAGDVDRNDGVPVVGERIAPAESERCPRCKWPTSACECKPLELLIHSQGETS